MRGHDKDAYPYWRQAPSPEQCGKDVSRLLVLILSEIITINDLLSINVLTFIYIMYVCICIYRFSYYIQI